MKPNYAFMEIQDRKNEKTAQFLQVLQNGIKSGDLTAATTIELPEHRDNFALSSQKLKFLQSCYMCTRWAWLSVDEARNLFQSQRRAIIRNYAATISEKNSKTESERHALTSTLDIPPLSENNGAIRCYDFRTESYSIICKYNKTIVYEDWKPYVANGSCTGTVSIYQTVLNLLEAAFEKGLTQEQFGLIMLLILEKNMNRVAGVVGNDKKHIKLGKVFNIIFKVLNNNSEIQKTEIAITKIVRKPGMNINLPVELYSKLNMDLLMHRFPFATQEELDRKNSVAVKRVIKDFITEPVRAEVETIRQQWDQTGVMYGEDEILNFINKVEECEPDYRIKSTKTIRDKTIEAQVYSTDAMKAGAGHNGADSANDYQVGIAKNPLQSTGGKKNELSKSTVTPPAGRGRGGGKPGQNGGARGKPWSAGHTRGRGRGGRGTYYVGGRGARNGRSRDRNSSTNRSRSRTGSFRRGSNAKTKPNGTDSAQQSKGCRTCGRNCGGSGKCLYMPNAVRSKTPCKMCSGCGLKGYHEPNSECIKLHVNLDNQEN